MHGPVEDFRIEGDGLMGCPFLDKGFDFLQGFFHGEAVNLGAKDFNSHNVIRS